MQEFFYFAHMADLPVVSTEQHVPLFAILFAILFTACNRLPPLSVVSLARPSSWARSPALATQPKPD